MQSGTGTGTLFFSMEAAQLSLFKVPACTGAEEKLMHLFMSMATHNIRVSACCLFSMAHTSSDFPSSPLEYITKRRYHSFLICICPYACLAQHRMSLDGDPLRTPV